MQIRKAVPAFIAACTMALLLVAPAGVTAQTKAAPEFTLRTAHYFKEDHPWHKGLVYFAKKVSDDSKGRIQIDIFNGGILGSEAQTMQFVKDGSLDFVVSDPSAAAPFAKEMDFFALPFLFRDYAHWQKSLDGAPGAQYAKIVEEKTGIKILGYWGGSSRNVLSTKKPVLSMDLDPAKVKQKTGAGSALFGWTTTTTMMAQAISKSISPTTTPTPSMP